MSVNQERATTSERDVQRASGKHRHRLGPQGILGSLHTAPDAWRSARRVANEHIGAAPLIYFVSGKDLEVGGIVTGRTCHSAGTGRGGK